ncbi:MAG: hypothetical protein MMC33_007347 [Icmadophila ericetorum]|nr:hypothetical protein [Icmadophila ericetorum]
MANPEEYLPPPFMDDFLERFLIEDLKLPRPIDIDKLETSGAYHTIYNISYPPSSLSSILQAFPKLPTHDGRNLILRISGHHLPSLKTINECAIMSYVASATSIPVPGVVRYSADTTNALGHEYQLFTRAAGVSVDKVYADFSTAQTIGFLDQIIDILAQLHALPFSHIGGLRFAHPSDMRGSIPVSEVAVLPGPVCEETFWQEPEIERYWNTPYGLNDTIETLNIKGPFPTYVAYISAHVGKHIYAISLHPLMQAYRDLVPKLQNFLAVINANQEGWQLNKTRIVLTHRDLHMGNIMYDWATSRITGVLDWEFGGCVPLPLWNKKLPFFWNTDHTHPVESTATKMRWVQMFCDRCKERRIDPTTLIDDGYENSKQEAMQTIQTYVRAICEVVPRGTAEGSVKSWKKVVEEHLEVFLD